MARQGSRRVKVGIVSSVFVLALVVGPPAGRGWAQAGAPGPGLYGAGRSASSGADAKLDALLRPAAARAERLATDEVAYVAIRSTAPLDLDGLALASVSTPWPLGQVVTLARVRLADLRRIATMDAVLAVEDAVNARPQTDEFFLEGRPAPPDPAAARARLAELRAREVPFAEAPPLAGWASAGATDVAAPLDPGAPARPDGWADVRVGHRSSVAWARGWRGEGVRVGVSDTGVDFASPEMQGTWAVVDDAQSPYNGWPMALDAQGLFVYVQDAQLGSTNTSIGAGAGHVATTQASRATRDWEGRGSGAGRACFRRVLTGNERDGAPVCDYKVPWRSTGGVYRFGVHPDATLLGQYGERPGVLVVDQGPQPGVYDTVYVDLDNDHDFTDEKPVTKADPLVYRDMDGDGWVDISGGLLYWIADGRNEPPGGYLWGDLAPTPGAGELVTFIGPFGGSHGTQCASNVVGQGRVPLPAGVVLPFRDLPEGTPPLHSGSAPGAKMVAMYRGGSVLVAESTYVFAAYGLDRERSGDEVQVLSNSYPLLRLVEEGWDTTSRLIDHLTIKSPSTSYLFSTGNGGPGYGSIRDPHPRNALKVAASTQMGSTGYDSITDTAQITWGDIAPFSSNGPGADGTPGVHIAADGASASGAYPVNAVGFDGRRTVRTWGGTSRSTPVAAGNMALVYQAFKASHTRWPTWEEARAILMAGAQHMGYDPFMTGAGVLDGGASAFIAGGVDGVYALPSQLSPGGHRGVAYGGFPALVGRGEERVAQVRLVNPSDRAATYDLRAQTSRRIGSTEIRLTSKPSATESPYYVHQPDYVVPIPKDRIPPGTELMAVRLIVPLAASDLGLNYSVATGGAAADNLWYLRLYQHTDIDGDGALWTDADADGVVDHANLATTHQVDGILDTDWSRTELDRWEFMRLADDTRPNNNEVVFAHHPLERWADGLYIGLVHRTRPAAQPTTELTFRLDFYAARDWDWLAVEPPSVTVPAGGEADVAVTFRVPADAVYGDHEGAVYGLRQGGPSGGSPYGRLTIPVHLNVAAALDVGQHPQRTNPVYLPVGWGGAAPAAALGADRAARPAAPRLVEEDAPEFGGAAAADADAPYPNGLVRGMNFWNYGPESGDWRYFFLDVPRPEEAGTRLLVRSTWDDGWAEDAGGARVPAADIDTLVFAPTADRWSDPRHPDNASESAADPAFFGPSTLEAVGGSLNTNTTGGIWRFQTATDGYDEWVTAPVREGLNLLVAHNTLISGTRVDVPFSMRVDRLRLLPTAVRAVGAGCQPVGFTPSFDAEGLAAEGFGLSMPTAFRGAKARQDDPAEPETASWRWAFDVAHGASVDVALDGKEGDDLDLFLYDDADGDGEPEREIGSSTTSAADEAISLARPHDGRYLVAVHGWSVPAGETTFDLVVRTVQGEAVRAEGLPPGPIRAGEALAFGLCYDLPADAPAGHYEGLFVFGPRQAPGLLSLPLEIWTQAAPE